MLNGEEVHVPVNTIFLAYLTMKNRENRPRDGC